MTKHIITQTLHIKAKRL